MRGMLVVSKDTRLAQPSSQACRTLSLRRTRLGEGRGGPGQGCARHAGAPLCLSLSQSVRALPPGTAASSLGLGPSSSDTQDMGRGLRGEPRPRALRGRRPWPRDPGHRRADSSLARQHFRAAC